MNTKRRRRCIGIAALSLALPIAVGGFLSSSPSQRYASLPTLATQTNQEFEFVSSTATKPPPSSPIHMLVEDRHEFELCLGKAVDTLKQDYPDLLTDAPDYSIYHPELEVVDPSGVKLHGISNYKNAFRLVHTIVNVFYCPERSLLTFRLVYDWARNNVRVSWNAEVVPRAIFGGTKTTLHVDGISVYVFDSSGKIIQHRVEHLMINDTPVAPERGIIHALEKQCAEPDCGIPVLSTERNAAAGLHLLKFQQSNPFTSNPTSLFSSNAAMTTDSNSDFDREAFEQKNKARQKFGLDPLTPEEFQEIEAQVQQLAKSQQQKQQATSTTAIPEKKEANIFEKMLGNVLEDTCESNFDCQRPQVCCDFGFKKMCCSSGMFVGHDGPRMGDRATVPVVAGYPPGMGPDDVPRRF